MIIKHRRKYQNKLKILPTFACYFVSIVLLKSIIKTAIHLTASNTTFGCNPYIQNIDVMKNKDVELIR